MCFRVNIDVSLKLKTIGHKIILNLREKDLIKTFKRVLKQSGSNCFFPEAKKILEKKVLRQTFFIRFIPGQEHLYLWFPSTLVENFEPKFFFTIKRLLWLVKVTREIANVSSENR